MNDRSNSGRLLWGMSFMLLVAMPGFALAEASILASPGDPLRLFVDVLSASGSSPLARQAAAAIEAQLAVFLGGIGVAYAVRAGDVRMVPPANELRFTMGNFAVLGFLVSLAYAWPGLTSSALIAGTFGIATLAFLTLVIGFMATPVDAELARFLVCAPVFAILLLFVVPFALGMACMAALRTSAGKGPSSPGVRARAAQAPRTSR